MTLTVTVIVPEMVTITLIFSSLAGAEIKRGTGANDFTAIFFTEEYKANFLTIVYSGNERGVITMHPNYLPLPGSGWVLDGRGLEPCLASESDAGAACGPYRALSGARRRSQGRAKPAAMAVRAKRASSTSPST